MSEKTNEMDIYLNRKILESTRFELMYFVYISIQPQHFENIVKIIKNTTSRNNKHDIEFKTMDRAKHARTIIKLIVKNINHI